MFSCLEFTKDFLCNSALAQRTLRRRRLRMAASNKIEFSYLNGNLMVPAVRPLTLGSDRNSRNVNGNDG
jgi:hypothetical protein